MQLAPCIMILPCIISTFSCRIWHQLQMLGSRKFMRLKGIESISKGKLLKIFKPFALHPRKCFTWKYIIESLLQLNLNPSWNSWMQLSFLSRKKTVCITDYCSKEDGNKLFNIQSNKVSEQSIRGWYFPV